MGFVGIIIVFVMVLGGYTLHHGKLAVLWQPTELMIIGGAAVGAMIISAPMSRVIAAVKGAISALTSTGFTKAQYMELLLMLFNLFQRFRKDGPQGVESHIEDPEKSDIFSQSPGFLKNHHAVDFLCDTMKVTLSADLSPYDVDDLLSEDIKIEHEEEHATQHLLAQTADAMPGLGIVAAVLGVVITMGKLDQGSTVIGQSVAAALVGTFLGVLMSYAFLGPMATKMGSDIANKGRYLIAIKVAMVALQRGAPPLVCVEFARRTLPPHDRPTFAELDESTKKK